MAMGAIRALADLGRKVPEDISVVGYDGIIGAPIQALVLLGLQQAVLRQQIQVDKVGIAGKGGIGLIGGA